MKSTSRTLVATAVVAGMSLSFTAQATNGILPLGNGMTAHGFGGAGIANAGDALAGVDNPALLADTGNQAAIGGSLFNPNRSIDVGDGVYHDSDHSWFLIPQGGWTTVVNDKVNAGILVTAMGGMNTEYPSDTFYPGSPKIGMDLSGLLVSGTGSYKIDEKTAIGGAIMFGYEALETFGPGVVGDMPMPKDEKDSATGYGFKLGVVSEVSPGVKLGAMYQSEISMGEMDKHCEYIFAPLKQAASCKLNMPTMLGAGINVAIDDRTKVVADVLQVNWSSVDVFGNKDYGFGWKDQTIFKIGVERKYGTDMAYRVGFNHGDSPIPNDSVGDNFLAPAVTVDHLTFGFTKNMGGMDLVGYYAYVLENEQTQTGSTEKAKMDQHALGLGVNWRL
jgi:long-chain fatty acid transport protein